MNLGIISYDFPHLKTDQVIQGLTRKNYDISFFLLPFKKRKPRQTFFNHRPDQSIGAEPKALVEKHNFKLYECENDLDIFSGLDYYLITGAGILSADCVQDKQIINCHPGIIPSVRGLDSFKYSILNKLKLGITLHYIDKETDSGEIISTRETNVYLTDTLERLASRHYENEIDMMINFEKFLAEPEFIDDEFEELPPTMRMNFELEKKMMALSSDYILEYGK